VANFGPRDFLVLDGRFFGLGDATIDLRGVTVDQARAARRCPAPAPFRARRGARTSPNGRIFPAQAAGPPAGGHSFLRRGSGAGRLRRMAVAWRHRPHSFRNGRARLVWRTVVTTPSNRGGSAGRRTEPQARATAVRAMVPFHHGTVSQDGMSLPAPPASVRKRHAAPATWSALPRLTTPEMRRAGGRGLGARLRRQRKRPRPGAITERVPDWQLVARHALGAPTRA
jgi:hypothetical protein